MKHLTDEEAKQVMDSYTAGRRIEDIANEVGINYSTLKWKINLWLKAGVLKKRKSADRKPYQFKSVEAERNRKERKDAKVRQPKKKVFRVRYERFVKGITPIPISEPVKCTREVSMKCVFGTSEFMPYNCDFCSITGTSRKCPAKACIHFLEVSETQKKYVSDTSLIGSMDNFF